jgi:hypothetical protein
LVVASAKWVAAERSAIDCAIGEHSVWLVGKKADGKFVSAIESIYDR